MSSASAADKSSYSLFHPVPDAELWDFDSDRPDKTNSAITVDAGHFQVGTDLLNYTRDGHGADKQETWPWGNVNFRLGLINQVDLQLMMPFAVNDGSITGLGDLSVALKANLWGNDGRKSAGGVEAVLTTLTGTHGQSAGTTQATFLAIYQQGLGSFDAAINTGLSIAANDDGPGHHTEIVNSISVSHALFGPVMGYAEFFTSVPAANRWEWIGTTDSGLLWSVSKNIQLDTGINLGVTHAADDLQVFPGLSWRM